MTVTCKYCDCAAELVAGEEIYPYRPDLFDLKFWLCAPCVAWVGVHKGTETPLGELANAETRSWRQRAHLAFDPLWKAKMERGQVSKRHARGAAYQWLAEQMGIKPEDCHISHMQRPELERVIEICKPYSDALKHNERLAA